MILAQSGEFRASVPSVLPGLQQEPGSRIPAEVADTAPEPRETLRATPDLEGAQRAWQGPEGCTPFSQ